jgi:hypothetical protein
MVHVFILELRLNGTHIAPGVRKVTVWAHESIVIDFNCTHTHTHTHTRNLCWVTEPANGTI